MNHSNFRQLPFMVKVSHSLVLIMVPVWMSGCASLATDVTGANVSAKERVEMAQWEAFNRDAYAFNKSLDDHVIKPVALAYKEVIPEFLDKGISNVFSNLSDVPNALNALLQFKLKDAASDTGRFAINSTIGLAGFFDVATDMKLQKHDEDFGQTLAKWGVPSGPYLMTPLMGPSSVRDRVGSLVDIVTNPYYYFEYSQAYSVLARIDQRADFLSVEGALKGVSDDEYSTLREAWIQRRKHLLNDGKLDRQALEKKASLIDELEALD